jgi:hypothetical protein
MPDPVIPHRPDVALYVLGALEGDELARFQEHLRGCEVCQAEVDDLQGPAALLQTPFEVPADLSDRTLGRVRHVARVAGRRRLLRRWAVAVGAAAALVLAAVVGFALSSSGLIGGRSDVVELALAAPCVGPARATAKIHQVDDGLTVDMTVSGLAPNPPGSVYECWFVGPNDSLERPNRVTAGTFTIGASGKATLRLHSAADLQRFPVMGVTLERDGADPRRSGDKVLVSLPAP